MLREGGALSLDDVREHFVAAGVARHKTPERVEVVADLPRTPSGKVRKGPLRDQLREEADSS
jgi:non-ribosomal peptide synthetase component E (peptide arylation enzyme)